MSAAAAGVPIPRARPVADAPVEGLVAAADELAGRWAVSLMRAHPLSRMGEIPLVDLIGEAPALCAQMARALRSDAELERLAAGHTDGRQGPSSGELRLAALAGAMDASTAALAVEALRAVLWEALLVELRWPGAEGLTRQLADLSDRLASVCTTALVATLGRRPAARPQEHQPPAPAPSRRETPARRLYPPAPAFFGSSPVSERVAPSAGAGATRAHREAPGGRAARIIDEWEDVRAPERATRAPDPRRSGPASHASEARAYPAPIPGRALPWELPLAGEPPSEPRPPRQESRTVRIRGAVPAGTDAGIRITRRPVPPGDEPA